MRVIIRAVLVAAVLAALPFFVYPHIAIPDPATLNLQDGDIILQNKLSLQSPAVEAATHSPYTHVGIIYHKPEGYYVIEATRTGVGERPFAAWVARGIGHKFTVIRHPNLTPQQKNRIIAAAHRYYGRGYDYYFSFDNKEKTIYCSELPYLAYKETGLSIGHVQQVKELSVDNTLVEILLRLRWKGSPYCQEKDITYAQCRKRVFEQQLITPASLAADPHMKQVYSNF